jgi:hypothetical protein
VKSDSIFPFSPKPMKSSVCTQCSGISCKHNYKSLLSFHHCSKLIHSMYSNNLYKFNILSIWKNWNISHLHTYLILSALLLPLYSLVPKWLQITSRTSVSRQLSPELSNASLFHFLHQLITLLTAIQAHNLHPFAMAVTTNT